MKHAAQLIAMMLLSSSCIDGIFDSIGEKVDTEGSALSHEMIVLGSQLEDPYSVENVTKALNSLYPTKADRVVVEPTNLYVRFLPSGEDQFERLEAMGLQLLDHPVDYQIVKEGDYYHDPEIDDEEITWQYAVVPKDFKFPSDIKYELIDKCYIPDDTATKSDGIDWQAVEREAYRLTGNEDMLMPLTKGDDNVSGKPKGRITIEDPEIGDEPFGVKGVMVSCNSFVKFSHSYTNADGEYEMSRSFSSNPRYRLVFKNKKGFAMGVNLLLTPASSSTLGKNPATGVDAHITAKSDRKLFTRCVVNNAAYDYYESCTEGGESMKTPPSNLRIWLMQKLSSSSAPMLQQGAIVDSGLLSDYLGEYLALVKMFLPDVTLGMKGLESYSDIYSITVHELSHASHYMQVGSTYWDQYIKYILTSFVTSGFVTYGVGTEKNHGYCEVGEMWAYCVQTELYQKRYEGSTKVFGTSYWFSPQIFMSLEDKGLSRFKIFSALTSDVTDRDKLQKKLVNLYPDFKSTINQAFSRYN